jgi:excisionase family DNA binding protein
MHPQANLEPEAARPALLLNRAALIKRWQHGSDAFFWREERAGRLLPVRHEGLLRYRLEDVLFFEGGLPNDEMAAAYAADLMHPDEVADVCKCTADYILKTAKAGKLPCRRIGRARRFVPAEVARWQQDRWATRVRRMNAKPKKKTPFTSDE